MRKSKYSFLLLDYRKNYFYSKKQELFLKELNKTNLKYEVSKLNIGDFTWIARPKSRSTIQEEDIVLDFIVERKRVDDLCQSKKRL